MSANLEFQQELMLLWKCRMKSIEGLHETGRKFNLQKPMNYMIVSSQKNYNAIITDMKKQMRLLNKQMGILQQEMNEMLKVLNDRQKADGESHSYS